MFSFLIYKMRTGNKKLIILLKKKIVILSLHQLLDMLLIPIFAL